MILRPLITQFLFLCILATPYTLHANHCDAHITLHEKAHKIPEGLLHAISKVESGRKDAAGRIVAWPWTINAEGKGYYFPTKNAAIAAVQQMQLRGISSIDVGCMQVNLHHHPHAFKDLEDAFDPSRNVAYAARFLTGLKNEHASWHKAVAHYHSSNPVHHIPYQRNVMLAWKQKGTIPPLLLAHDRFGDKSNPNRIRRLTTKKTLSLQNRVPLLASNKMAVRRISTRNSRHFHTVK